MANETVPGMAEAIEARRVKLGLTVGEMVRRSGVTAPGLAPLRRGLRRSYEDSTRFGLADALQWERDAVDRLLDGQPPVPLVEAPEDAVLAKLGEVAEAVRLLERRIDRLTGGDR